MVRPFLGGWAAQVAHQPAASLPVATAGPSGATATSTPGSGMDFAERLALWVGPIEAIALEAAHRTVRQITEPRPARGATRPASRPAALAASLAEDVQRVREALAHAIAQDPLPPPAPGADLAKDAAWPAYQQQHLHLQRRMDRLIGTLREHVRESMGRVSARLRQLAALDAVLAQTLASRQERLLPTVPALLQRRYEQLRKAHQHALETTGALDDPARWRAEGAWLHRFEQDWRQALRGEIELRLEPVLGLVEALAQDMNHETP